MFAEAVALAQDLTDKGVPTYTDPAKAAANRPCVLVTPPVVSWQTKSAVWTLAALTKHDAGSEDAFRDLDATVAKVAAALDGYVESARPSAYYLTKDVPSVPAYLITLTTSPTNGATP
jgi:hypothetical protein